MIAAGVAMAGVAGFEGAEEGVGVVAAGLAADGFSLNGGVADAELVMQALV